MSRGPCSRHLSGLRSHAISATGVSPRTSNKTFQRIRMKAAFLPDRGVVKVSGADARNFLNGLVTTDVTLLRPNLGRFGALLTPQGKITTDFLITEAPSGHGGGFLIDCPRVLAQGLAHTMGVYRRCAKGNGGNLFDSLGVLAAWDGKPAIKPD